MLTANLFIFLVPLQGIISLRISTQQELYVTIGQNAPIVLNCTYAIENNEDISYMYLYWKKSNGSNYAILAEYYPDNYASVNDEGDYLRNRSYLVNPANGSTSAILTINDVRCEDDGRYQCYVWYLPKGGKKKEDTQDTAVILQADAEQPIKFTIYPNNSLEENDTATLSCYANVGNPDGYVTIVKMDKSSTASVLLNETAIVGSKTENCTTLVNATVTYIISRDDNGAHFRCFSKNRLTQGIAPSRDIQPIKVFYGPSSVRISPSDLNFVTGSNVNLTCSSDGRPAPSFKWTFNSSDIKNNEKFKLSSNGSVLSLRNINLNHSGIYVCMASNSVNEKTMNRSLSVTLRVQEKEESVTEPQSACDANPCGITERCSEADGKASCATNTWSVIALVFIVLSLVFMVTTVILCIKRRDLNKSSINVDVPLPLIEGDDFGGYADPMDVKKINGQVENKVSDTEEHGDPVDQTCQYASVQKSPPDAPNPPNVYDGAWN